jgi:CelD/BcsL family acetyltransferase involved in cellulose biosynthesis
VERIELDRFRELAAEYDAAVAGCSDIDRYCSSSDWLLPAHDALMPPRECLLFRDANSWIALARGAADGGAVYLEPLEASWALASPIAGADPAMFLEVCRSQRWDVMLLAGVLDQTPTQTRFLRALLARFEVRLGSRTRRHVADLRDGLDGYLARRSRNFRRSVSRAKKRVSEAGIDIEVADHADPVGAFERVVDIEVRSWKGRARMGIESGPMSEFYRQITRRLAKRGALRLRFARRDGRDVAYILGGLFATTYRGLQFSFDAEFSDLGLGNALQYDQMAALCDEGIGTYDLGTTGDYKGRWTDRAIDSQIFFVIND